MYEMLSALVRALAPVLSFTCDEVWEHMPRKAGEPGSVFEAPLPTDFHARWHDPAVAASFEKLLEVREAALKDMEQKRRDKVIGHSLEAHLSIDVGESHPALPELKRMDGQLEELFIVSSVEVRVVSGDGLSVASRHADGTKCVRCWHWSDNTGRDAEYEGVCSRCSGVLRRIKEHHG
jgi:isoleucyl-tRNA synthetase